MAKKLFADTCNSVEKDDVLAIVNFMVIPTKNKATDFVVVEEGIAFIDSNNEIVATIINGGSDSHGRVFTHLNPRTKGVDDYERGGARPWGTMLVNHYCNKAA